VADKTSVTKLDKEKQKQPNPLLKTMWYDDTVTHTHSLPLTVNPADYSGCVNSS